MVEDLLAREHAPRIGEQVAQQPVLGRGQLDRHPATRDLARLVVELEVLESEPAGLLPRVAGPAQDGADAGDQLLQAERLGDVVVAAQREPADLVGGGIARGQEDDRDIRPAVAEPARDVEALDVGQHHVEHDQLRLERRRRGERLGAGRGRLDLEAVEAQRHRDDVEDVRLIVDDEHAVAVRARGHRPGLSRASL
jgi:hypothetical protein